MFSPAGTFGSSWKRFTSWATIRLRALPADRNRLLTDDHFFLHNTGGQQASDWPKGPTQDWWLAQIIGLYLSSWAPWTWLAGPHVNHTAPPVITASSWNRGHVLSGHSRFTFTGKLATNTLKSVQNKKWASPQSKELECWLFGYNFCCF